MAKEIFNIFSKEPIETIEEDNFKEKRKIIIDFREKNSLLPAQLVKEGFELNFKQLKVADYLIKEVAIERKTVADFKHSIMNKRIFNQLSEISQYEKRILIIEGINDEELYNDYSEKGMSANAIRGFLLSIVLNYKVPIIFTKNCEDTAQFMRILHDKSKKEPSLNVSKKTFTKKERLQFIMESFPGIGPKTAKKILEEKKTLKNIANSSLEDLEEIFGKKAEILFKILNDEY